MQRKEVEYRQWAGAILRELREHRRWSQRQLAEAIAGAQGHSVQRSTISAWERGQGKLTMATVMLVADLAGRSLADLLGDDSDTRQELEDLRRRVRRLERER